MSKLAILALAFCALLASPVSATDYGGKSDFKTKGYPSIAFMVSLAFIFWGLSSGYSTGGGDLGSKESKIFMAVNSINLFTGIFYLFGPAGAMGPNAPLLGTLTVWLVALGYFIIFTEHQKATAVYLLLALLTLGGYLGMFADLGMGVSITNFDGALCNQWFGRDTLDRCLDDQYLQLLRLFGWFTIYCIAVSLTIVFPRMEWPFVGASPAHIRAPKSAAPQQGSYQPAGTGPTDSLVGNSFQSSSGPAVTGSEPQYSAI